MVQFEPFGQAHNGSGKTIDDGDETVPLGTKCL
jgi:hypothetical protein